MRCASPLDGRRACRIGHRCGPGVSDIPVRSARQLSAALTEPYGVHSICPQDEKAGVHSICPQDEKAKNLSDLP